MVLIRRCIPIHTSLDGVPRTSRDPRGSLSIPVESLSINIYPILHRSYVT